MVLQSCLAKFALIMINSGKVPRAHLWFNNLYFSYVPEFLKVFLKKGSAVGC